MKGDGGLQGKGKGTYLNRRVHKAREGSRMPPRLRTVQQSEDDKHTMISHLPVPRSRKLPHGSEILSSG